MKNIEKLLFVTIIGGLFGGLVALIIPFPHSFFVAFPISIFIGFYGSEIYDHIFKRNKKSN
jgi:hypothetical protein